MKTNRKNEDYLAQLEQSKAILLNQTYQTEQNMPTQTIQSNKSKTPNLNS